MFILQKRSVALGLSLLIAGCSSPSEQARNTAAVPKHDGPLIGPAAAPTSPTSENAAVGTVTADTPVNSENYAEVMAARSQEYERLEYKPVTLNSFQCGDNCYLELTGGVEGAAPEKVLCTASQCADWQASGSLPMLRNKGARAKFGTANQVDGVGKVMKRNVRAVIDLRVPSTSQQPASARTSASADGGTLPLERGVYVATGADCKEPANAEIRIWNGTGLSGSATRNCRPTIKSRKGNTYTVSNSCENTYDGTRTAEQQSITVSDATHFTLAGQKFRKCPSGAAPYDFQKSAR